MIKNKRGLFIYREELDIQGVKILGPRVFNDSRGSVTKLFNFSSYSDEGIENKWKEMLITDNIVAGTIRGFHFQKPPFEQAKIMAVSRGEIYLWLLDIRKESNTYGKVVGTRIDAVNKHIVYIPVGVANAYQVILKDTQVLYLLSNEYNETASTGVLWESMKLAPIIGEKIFSEGDLKLPQWAFFKSPF